jgi:hypothetical protein
MQIFRDLKKPFHFSLPGVEIFNEIFAYEKHADVNNCEQHDDQDHDEKIESACALTEY